MIVPIAERATLSVDTLEPRNASLGTHSSHELYKKLAEHANKTCHGTRLGSNKSAKGWPRPIRKSGAWTDFKLDNSYDRCFCAINYVESILLILPHDIQH